MPGAAILSGEGSGLGYELLRVAYDYHFAFPVNLAL